MSSSSFAADRSLAVSGVSARFSPRTSRRSRAYRRTTAGSSVPVELARIEDPLRVELLLDPLHHVERSAVLRAHVARAHRARPVLTGHRTADLDREPVQPVRELVGAPD